MKPQIATTIEQSQRLLKKGVDSGSADMSVDTDTGYYYLCPFHQRADQKHELPAWSLSALLAMLPQRLLAPKNQTPCDFMLHHFPDGWMTMYHDGKMAGDTDDFMWQCVSQQMASDPIEACVKMIEWLDIKTPK